MCDPSPVCVRLAGCDTRSSCLLSLFAGRWLWRRHQRRVCPTLCGVCQTGKQQSAPSTSGSHCSTARCSFPPCRCLDRDATLHHPTSSKAELATCCCVPAPSNVPTHMPNTRPPQGCIHSLPTRPPPPSSLRSLPLHPLTYLTLCRHPLSTLYVLRRVRSPGSTSSSTC